MVSETDRRDIAQAYLERGIELGIEQGIAQGLEQGLAQGKVEERLDIARRMLAIGCKPEFIAQATTFSMDEIKGLV